MQDTLVALWAVGIVVAAWCAASETASEETYAALAVVARLAGSAGLRHADTNSGDAAFGTSAIRVVFAATDSVAFIDAE